jgi:hypothetical protein
MKVTIQVMIERDDEPPIVDQIACLERAMLTPDTLGLTLAEAKTVLAQLQDTLVKEQAVAYVAQEQTCPHCGAPRRCKGHHQIVVRSLFGKLTLSSPRLYTCTCQADHSRQSSSPLADLLPERTTPELRYLEAKWAALLPYGVTVGVLEEVLPLHANHTSVYRHLHQVAERLEGELGDETISNWGLDALPPTTRFRYNHLVVLPPAHLPPGTAPRPALCGIVRCCMSIRAVPDVYQLRIRLCRISCSASEGGVAPGLKRSPWRRARAGSWRWWSGRRPSGWSVS